MFSNEKPRTSNLRNAYAQHSDFCSVFEKGIKPLYLLAFLMTANHKDAEQCFVSTVEEAFKEQAVFKGWERSWVKRCATVSREISALGDQQHDARPFDDSHRKRPATRSLFQSC